MSSAHVCAHKKCSSEHRPGLPPVVADDSALAGLMCHAERPFMWRVCSSLEAASTQETGRDEVVADGAAGSDAADKHPCARRPLRAGAAPVRPRESAAVAAPPPEAPSRPLDGTPFPRLSDYHRAQPQRIPPAIRAALVDEAVARAALGQDEADARRAITAPLATALIVFRGLDPLRRALSRAVRLWLARRVRGQLARARLARVEQQGRDEISAEADAVRWLHVGCDACVAEERLQRAAITAHALLLLAGFAFAYIWRSQSVELCSRVLFGGAAMWWSQLGMAEQEARRTVEEAAQRARVDEVVKLYSVLLREDEEVRGRAALEASAESERIRLARLYFAVSCYAARRDLEETENSARACISVREYADESAKLRRAMIDVVPRLVVGCAIETALCAGLMRGGP